MAKSAEIIVNEILDLFRDSGVDYDQMLDVLQVARGKVLYAQRSIALSTLNTEGAANEQADWTPPKPE